MSVGQVGNEGASELDANDAHDARLADVLAADEEVRLSWSATEVRWANEWRSSPDGTAFVATDRRVVFVDGDSTTAIGYDHVRAVRTDPAGDGVDASTMFLASGGLSLVVGLVVATSDPLNGVGLVAMAVALLVAGAAYDGADSEATTTIVIDNERQRLSFVAPESVGTELADLVDGS